jgi:hypothetical protein
MYYVYLNNATYGPYTEQQVRQMVATGQVNASTLVFEPGGKQQWLPASHFPGFFRSTGFGATVMRNPVATSIPITPGNLESTVWQGRPSVWMLLERFAGPSVLVVFLLACVVLVREWIPNGLRTLVYCVAGGCITVFLLWFSWDLIVIKSTEWILTTERLCHHKGVFNRTVDNLELYRIKDITLTKPFLMRLVGCGYVGYATSDQSDKPYIRVGPIRKPDDFYGIFRKYVERQRQQKGVKELDIWRS